MIPDNSAAPEQRRLNRVPVTVAWLAAAAFAIVAAWMLSVSLGLRTANGLLETERDLARVSDKLARTQLEERTFLAEKIITELGARSKPHNDLAHLRVALLEPASTAEPRGAIVWDPTRQTGLVVVSNLPKLASDEILQLWIESRARPPQSAGTFETESPTLSSPFALTEAPAEFTGFILTIEKTPAPTTPGRRIIGRASAR